MPLVGAGGFSIATLPAGGNSYDISFENELGPVGSPYEVGSVSHMHNVMTRLCALVEEIKVRIDYGFKSVDLKHLGATLRPQNPGEMSVKAEVVHIVFIDDMLHACHTEHYHVSDSLHSSQVKPPASCDFSASDADAASASAR